MTPKSDITVEQLSKLGIDRLAELVLNQAANDKIFKRTVKTALASLKGSKSVAAAISKRLSALERARGFVDWDKARAFALDLEATVNAIVNELGKSDPHTATELLIRFIAGHYAIYERIDDSNGEVQYIYQCAIEKLKTVVVNIPQNERGFIPSLVQSQITKDDHGYKRHLIEETAHLLNDETLLTWDKLLIDEANAILTVKTTAPTSAFDKDEWRRESQISDILNCRAEIANARGDFDGLIAIVSSKSPNVRDNLMVAEALFKANRLTEALFWSRRKRHIRDKDVTPAITEFSWQEIELQRDILVKQGERQAARDLLWRYFEHDLTPKPLKSYIVLLPDFEDVEAIDKAFEFVLKADNKPKALQFFIDWADYPKAAQVVLNNPTVWNGRDYYTLPKAADTLEHTSPMAAIVLWRCLLDDILNNARTTAYGHAAKYYKKLEATADKFEQSLCPTFVSPQAYTANLKTVHGKKSSFWALITKQ